MQHTMSAKLQYAEMFAQCRNGLWTLQQGYPEQIQADPCSPSRRVTRWTRLPCKEECKAGAVMITLHQVGSELQLSVRHQVALVQHRPTGLAKTSCK